MMYKTLYEATEYTGWITHFKITFSGLQCIWVKGYGARPIEERSRGAKPGWCGSDHPAAIRQDRFPGSPAGPAALRANGLGERRRSKHDRCGVRASYWLLDQRRFPSGAQAQYGFGRARRRSRAERSRRVLAVTVTILNIS